LDRNGLDVDIPESDLDDMAVVQKKSNNEAKMMIRFVLVFSLMLLTSAFADNLIQNGDFESGSLDGWTSGDQGFLSTVAYSGSYGCQIENRGTLEQIVIGLDAGADYILTVYTKCGANGRSNPGATDFGRSVSSNVITDTTWQEVKIRFRTGLENSSAKIFISNLRNETTIYADDFLLVKDDHSAFESMLPMPPKGFHWEIIPHLSDEFEEDRLDPTKWLNYHPYWAGRAPSNHKRENVSVTEGFLRLANTSRVDDLESVADPQKDIWVDAACVASKNRDVNYGYYEARVKESLISMTSAFWFQGQYSEIDVIENLGAPSDNNGHEKQMHMNTHYYPGGWDNDQSTPKNWIMPYPAGEDFHVYGMWWIDEQRINFYHNGELVEEVELPGDYDEPMYMFFDTEVFTWEGLPTIESLNDPQRHTMFVDWVRSWELVPGEASRIESEEKKPQQFRLFQNYPNPFNPLTTIQYHLNNESHVQLTVYNTLGRAVKRLVNTIQPAGLYAVSWDGRDEYGRPIPTGVYYYAIESSGFMDARKLVLLQ